MIEQMLDAVLEPGYSANEATCGLWSQQKHGVVEVEGDLFGWPKGGVDF